MCDNIIFNLDIDFYCDQAAVCSDITSPEAWS